MGVDLKGLTISRQYRWRVQGRLVVLQYAAEYGIRAAARRYGLDRKTVRAWRKPLATRWGAGVDPTVSGSRPRRIAPEALELIKQARIEFGFGAARTRIWMMRVHKYAVAASTIQHICRDLGLPSLHRPRRRPRGLKLFEREQPGDCIQVDVKNVKIAGQKVFQYTALDDCTRYRVLRLYRRKNQWASLDFFDEIRQAFHFSIRKVQSDNGAEFPFLSRSDRERLLASE